jgi:anti-sigma-K factor RskA
VNEVNTDIHALSGAYVLNALSDIERAAFDRHLDRCDSCTVEVAELREAAGRLAAGSWSVPSPRLREGVLAEIRRTRQVGPGRPERDGTVSVSRWRRRTALAVAAGVLAAGAGTVSYVVQEQRVREERSVAAAAQAEVARMASVLSAPDAILKSTTGPGGGRITLAMSPGRDEGVAMLTGLPAHGPGHSYQLWVIDAKGPRSAGVLTAGATDARHLVTGVRGADHFGVTLEPAGGSDEPNFDVAATIPM